MNDKQVDMICRSIIAAAVIVADNRGDDMLKIGSEADQSLLANRVDDAVRIVFKQLVATS